MDKTKFTSAQQKIYYDKSQMSDKALLEITNSEGKYVYDVVAISKLILAERGVLSSDVLNEIENEGIGITEEVKKTPMNVDGPPYDKSFGNTSFTIIILSVLTGLFYGLTPKSDRTISITILVAMFIISIWAAVAAFNYLKKINQSPALAIICFLFPLIGLLIVRYHGYGFARPEVKLIFDKASIYFNFNSKQIIRKNENTDITEGEAISKLKEEVNGKLNEKVDNFLQWIENDGKEARTKEEIENMIVTLVADFEFEAEPLPIIDISFKMDQPEVEPEEEPVSEKTEEKESVCPACGFKISSDDKECPDCGITLS